VSPLTRRRLKWWALILASLLAFAAAWVTVAVAFAEPAFAKLDDVDFDKVASVELLILNRPDGGPDIGSPRSPFDVPRERRAAMLAPLLKAELAEAPRSKTWLGKMTVVLADGRRQPVYLYYVAAENPKRVWFKIGPHQYLGGKLEEFVRAAS
jgi:hypothetical protein